MSHKQYRSATRDLISFLYHHGYKVAIFDEMDYRWIEFDSAAKAWEEVNAVDGGEDFSVVTPEGKRQGGVILAIGYNDPEEEVCDFSCTPILEQWFDQYIERY